MYGHEKGWSGSAYTGQFHETLSPTDTYKQFLNIWAKLGKNLFFWFLSTDISQGAKGAFGPSFRVLCCL